MMSIRNAMHATHTYQHEVAHLVVGVLLTMPRSRQRLLGHRGDENGKEEGREKKKERGWKNDGKVQWLRWDSRVGCAVIFLAVVSRKLWVIGPRLREKLKRLDSLPVS